MAVHVLVIGLVGWATGGTYEAYHPVTELRITRSYAVHDAILIAPDPETEPAAPPGAAHLPRVHVAQARLARAAAVAPPLPPHSEPGAVPTLAVSLSGPKATPAGAGPASADGVQELRPGEVVGIGQVLSKVTDHTPNPGILAKLGFGPPAPEELGTPEQGANRVAELVTGTSSACPAFEPPANWTRPVLDVSVSFVVDTDGVVDSSSIHVVESPSRPWTDRLYHAHVYVVAASLRPAARPMTPAGYDSLITSRLSRHAASLTFRPALAGGQPVRSSVLISCQLSQRG